jgi:type II secretory pathway pseudopilin PulG
VQSTRRASSSQKLPDTYFLAAPKSGLTLLELVIVLSILVALGGMAIRLAGDAYDAAQQQATRGSLASVRDAVAQYWSDTKHLSYIGPPSTVAVENERFHLRWLFRNPVDDSTRAEPSFFDHSIGWNGPYLLTRTGQYRFDTVRGFTADYGASGDPAILDGFPVTVSGERLPGSPLVIQDVNPGMVPRDVRVVSAGPNGVIDIPRTIPTAELSELEIADDVFVALQLR